MPLTSVLKQKNHWVTLFINSHFKDLNDLTKEIRKNIDDSSLIIPNAFESKYPWNNVGNVSEYMFVWFFTKDIKSIYPVMIIKHFYPSLVDKLNNEINKLKSASDEEKILFCLKLSKFESLMRIGKQVGVKGLDTMIFGKNTFSQNVVDDCRNIFNTNLKNTTLMKQYSTILVAPNFDPYGLVGGADGDFIIYEEFNKTIEGTLIDFKTTKDPFKKDFIIQLIGYFLLDIGNEYRLKNIGVYMARHNYVWKTSIEDLLLDFSDFKSLPEARDIFLQRIKEFAK